MDLTNIPSYTFTKTFQDGTAALVETALNAWLADNLATVNNVLETKFTATQDSSGDPVFAAMVIYKTLIIP